MTPLAQRIVKELTRPLGQRELIDDAGLLRKMDDVHCFDYTEALPLVDELADQIQDTGVVDSSTSFLPAPKTWMEAAFPHPDGFRVRLGWLLEETQQHNFVKAATVTYDGSYFSSRTCGLLNLGSAFQPLWDSKIPADFFTAILAALALINTPKIIGRRQHMPHRGLERALLREQAVIGKFPLHAWTEIKLECRPPKDLSGEPGYEAHLTGRRCLHFCRAHLRIKNGRVEFVKAHWRGDGALGIKRSRYRLSA